MKKNFRFLAMAVVAMAAAVFTGCSSDDDFLAPYEESAIQTRAISSTNALIDFDNVPSSVRLLTSMETISILPRPTASR